MAWVGSCQVRYPFVIAGVAVLALMLAPGPFRWVALPLVLVALLLSHVRVVVNDHGLKASLGGVIRRRYPLDRVTSSNVIDLEPNQWGGWGYRMLPGRSAMVLRRGPAIELELANGRRFAVTVDDANTGAGLVNGLLARHQEVG